MTAQENGNKPAFPCEAHITDGGLTKREQLAATILSGLLANGSPSFLNGDMAYSVDKSVMMADVLLVRLHDDEAEKKVDLAS